MSNVVTTIVMLVLFPGLLALKIVEALTEPRRRTDFDKLATAIAFCVAIYFSYLGVSFAFHLPHIPVAYNPDGIWPISVHSWSVLAISALTLFWGYLVGKIMERGIPQWINYKEWITDRGLGGAQAVCTGVFNDYGDKWLRVHLRNGDVLQGAIEWFSDDVEKPEIFLGGKWVPEGIERRVLMISKTGEQEYIDGPGILLSKDAPIDFIEFLDGRHSD